MFNIGRDHIYVHLPHYQLLSNSSCGAATLRSIGSYWGFGPKKESDWKKILGTNEYGGTPPKSIVRTLRDFGLSVKIESDMDFDNLIYNVQQGWPVICPIQAWGIRRSYRNTMCCHWISVIGCDDKNLYCEDSYVMTKARGYISIDKFLTRWHDLDMYGKYWYRLGMVVKADWSPMRVQKLYRAAEIW
jgi:predicted double-glycine peptidase